MIDVTLYVLPASPPCAEVERQLRTLAAQYPHRLTIRDLSQDAARQKELGPEVPVVEVAGRRVTAPLTPEALASALAVAQAIDQSTLDEQEGTLAGDNTLLVLFADEPRLERWLRRFRAIQGLPAPDRGVVAARPITPEVAR